MVTASDEEFRVVARAYRRLAQAMRRTSQLTRAHDSQAGADAGNRTLDGAWGRVGREVAYRSAPMLFFACDHLFALAHLIAAENVVTAQLTVARSVLENLASAFWFHDPEIEFGERVRRHANLRLERLAEEVNLLGERATSQLRAIEEISDSARILGLPFTPGKRPWEPARVGSALPSKMRLAAELVSASASPRDGGHVPYRFYSAVAHGGEHLLGAFVMSEREVSDPGVARVEWGISLASLATYLAPLLLASDAAIRRVGTYQGWDLSLWKATYARALFELQPFLDS